MDLISKVRQSLLVAMAIQGGGEGGSMNCGP